MTNSRLSLIPLLVLLVFACAPPRSPLPDGPRRIEILFLGHASEHHNAARYLPMLATALTPQGINFTYTDSPDDLNDETLAYYDGLIVYANHDKITPEQEAALLKFVASGKGFIPIHSASFCFQNSEAYIGLVGGQFKEHDVGTFVTSIVAPDHPALHGVDTFSTWDETYVHDKLSDDRTVLMERVEGSHREPWTWTRNHGKGRVFYTAYGHDERTWQHPTFHHLLRSGILWAVGDDVRAQWEEFAATLPTLRYRDEANIPNYEQRNPPPKYQEPLSPEESAKLIQVPSGFDLELFASEPDIVNPVAMNWDERGRLWVIETVDYPNTVRKDDQGDDRIKICEDTDGDGKADKFTIFADGLNIPTSLVFANGGVIVAQAPHFLFLKDTDGDDRADVREVIMDGWGTFDTHAGPSNLTYGFDNRIWGVVGYAGFKGTIAGTPHEFSQGVYRFSRDLSEFEFLTSTSNNTWGLGFTENNDVFASTANNTHSVYVGISDRQAEGVNGIPLGSMKIDGHYAMRTITDKVRQVDVFGGFTAASGHAFYHARQFPRRFWEGTAFISEPTGHLVHIARIEKDGAGFIEKDGWNLFASSDEWVAPVAAETGPDGAVWVLDWYNFIVQHNPTPTPERGGYAAENGPGNAYVNPLRDRTHGRIWRVVWREADEYRPITLDRNDPEMLLKTLSHENRFWRMTAQRLLVERGEQDVVPRLKKLVERRRDNERDNFAAMHALWTLHGLGATMPDSDTRETVRQALNHPAPGVRKAAIQVLGENGLTEEEILESNVLHDTDANTRLAALLTLKSLEPSEKIGQTLYALSREDVVRQDNMLASATYASATRHRDGFLQAFREENPHFQPVAREHRREVPHYDDTSWKTMLLPSSFEDAGLDIDGIVWYRREFTLPSGIEAHKAQLSLGPIDESDEVWINGIYVGGLHGAYATPRLYEIPPRVLKAGKNVIAIRVEDTGSRGGIYGEKEQLFLKVRGFSVSLASEWKYEIEKQYNITERRPLFAQNTIAELFAMHYQTEASDTQTADAAVSSGSTATTVVLKAVVNEMKFDRTHFSVQAGKPVKIVFENPDFMQHNVVIARPGTLEKVGRAADKLATDPAADHRQYVPDMPDVLFFTSLVDPGKTVTLEFVAPETPGEYPFICTFPGHWSIMNGVMEVVDSNANL